MLSSLVSRFVLIVSLAATAVAAPVYKGAIVIEARSGEVLFEDNADYVGPPASVTKLMTFLVVKDAIRSGRLTLKTPVTTTAADSRIGGTQVWLKEGEVFEVEELLTAMMIQSANDAAHALAHAAAGSREAFVEAMNARARALGMSNTTWRTPHGLPASSRRIDEGDVTSPRDLATLSRALIAETDILRYTSVPLAYFGQGKREKPVMMDNHNNLVGKVRGVDGLKTGFTRSAGFCLAATAERDGRRLIAVIMGSPSSKERDVKMAELLENGFAKLPPLPTKPERPRDPNTITISPAPESAPTPVSAAPVSTAPADKDEEPPTVRFQLPGGKD